MNRRQVLMIAFAASFLCAAALSVVGVPSRVTSEDQARRDRVEMRLAQIHAEAEKMAEKADAPAESDSPAKTEAPANETPEPEKDKEMWPDTAPDVFKVQFECTNGTFVVECTKQWAPVGVERFYTLVREGFFDDTAFFRVVPNFVVQFGLAADPAVTAKWRNQRLQDDPVTQTNAPGTLTFATSGPNSRTTQLFINLVDNRRLDGMGFSPFGKVVEGMDVVKQISAEHGERPQQGLINQEGNSYLRKNFPKLDYIKKAELIK